MRDKQKSTLLQVSRFRFRACNRAGLECGENFTLQNGVISRQKGDGSSPKKAGADLSIDTGNREVTQGVLRGEITPARST